MAATSDRENSWKATMMWLQPATEGAVKIAQSANVSSSKLQDIRKRSTDELQKLPKCNNSTTKSKISDFCSSMDEAVSAGEDVKTSCSLLSTKWHDFKNHMEIESEKPDTASVKSVEVILAMLENLKVTCGECGEKYSVVREKLTKALSDCSIVERALADETSMVRKQQEDKNVSAMLWTVVVTPIAAAATMVTAGAAAPLAVGAFGLVCSLGLSADELGKLATTFDSARGSMQSSMAELNSGLNMIDQLEKQTEDMAKSIETGHGMHRRFKGALEEKDNEIEKLKRMLAN